MTHYKIYKALMTQVHLQVHHANMGGLYWSESGTEEGEARMGTCGLALCMHHARGSKMCDVCVKKPGCGEKVTDGIDGFYTLFGTLRKAANFLQHLML